jgi:hypothetical protein
MSPTGPVCSTLRRSSWTSGTCRRTKASVDPSNWRIEPPSGVSLAEVPTWRFEPPYDFSNDDGKPVQNPERFFAVRDEDGRLVGSSHFEERKATRIFYGLGLRLR